MGSCLGSQNRPTQAGQASAAALHIMQSQRAPDVNGLTVELYRAFWDTVAHDMLEMFNESLALGSLTLSCQRAVVTFLSKKGNLQDIKKWHPVSLLSGLQDSVQGFCYQVEGSSRSSTGIRPTVCPASPWWTMAT